MLLWWPQTRFDQGHPAQLTPNQSARSRFGQSTAIETPPEEDPSRAAPGSDYPRSSRSGGNRLCHALADAYSLGAAAAGHEVTRIEVACLDFPILRTKEESETGPLPESLVEAQKAIISAQHLVVVFPLWHGTMPALLKAFIE